LEYFCDRVWYFFLVKNDFTDEIYKIREETSQDKKRKHAGVDLGLQFGLAARLKLAAFEKI